MKRFLSFLFLILLSGCFGNDNKDEMDNELGVMGITGVHISGASQPSDNP